MMEPPSVAVQRSTQYCRKKKAFLLLLLELPALLNLQSIMYLN